MQADYCERIINYDWPNPLIQFPKNYLQLASVTRLYLKYTIKFLYKNNMLLTPMKITRITNEIFSILSGPIRFSTCVCQNAWVNTVSHAMMCDVYFV